MSRLKRYSELKKIEAELEKDLAVLEDRKAKLLENLQEKFETTDPSKAKRMLKRLKAIHKRKSQAAWDLQKDFEEDWSHVLTR